MSQEKYGSSEFFGNMMNLMSTEKLITYHLLEEELRISGKELSAIHLEMQMDVLLKQLKIVLNERRDLVIGTIPHRNGGNAQLVE